MIDGQGYGLKQSVNDSKYPNKRSNHTDEKLHVLWGFVIGTNVSNFKSRKTPVYITIITK